MKEKFCYILLFNVTIICYFGCKSDSALTESDSNLALFPGTKLITLSSPVDGSIVDREITFVWSPANQQNVTLGLFEKPIVVNNGAVVNKTDHIWAWHKGLSNGQDGLVGLSDGYPVINGEWKDEGYTKITNGKEYFWAVWTQDENGRVNYSSQVFKFRFQQQSIFFNIDGFSGDTTNISKFLGYSIDDFNGTNMPRTLTFSADWGNLRIEFEGYYLFGKSDAPYIRGLGISQPPQGWRVSGWSTIQDARSYRNFQVSWWKGN